MKEKGSPIVLPLVPAFIDEYGKCRRHHLLASAKEGAKAGVFELCFNGVFELLLGTKTSSQQAKKSITMCSILNAMSQLNLHHDNSQSISLSSKEEDLVEWCDALNFFARLVAYIAILVVMVLVVLIVLKYMTELNNERDNLEVTRSVIVSETNRLWPEKAEPITYGTCENDVETGSCSSGEDLYDSRICVICYDEQRNCFFVPCGHCATCYECALRIYDEENRMCPVCRRIIGKVRKLFAP